MFALFLNRRWASDIWLEIFVRPSRDGDRNAADAGLEFRGRRLWEVPPASVWTSRGMVRPRRRCESGLRSRGVARSLSVCV
eukprot:3408682-Rhodomonas_salina.1